MPNTAQKLEILLKKSRQNAYDLRRKLSQLENKLAAAEMTIGNQSAILSTKDAEIESLKKENAKLKRQSKATLKKDSIQEEVASDDT